MNLRRGSRNILLFTSLVLSLIFISIVIIGFSNYMNITITFNDYIVDTYKIKYYSNYNLKIITIVTILASICSVGLTIFFLGRTTIFKTDLYIMTSTDVFLLVLTISNVSTLINSILIKPSYITNSLTSSGITILILHLIAILMLMYRLIYLIILPLNKEIVFKKM